MFLMQHGFIVIPLLAAFQLSGRQLAAGDFFTIEDLADRVNKGNLRVRCCWLTTRCPFDRPPSLLGLLWANAKVVKLCLSRDVCLPQAAS